MATGVRVTRLLGLRERATGVDEEQGQAEVKPKKRLKMNAKSMSRSDVFIVSVRKDPRGTCEFGCWVNYDCRICW